ncbi:HAD family hydrolase [Paenibacillus protaetiae]|uniref:HAD family hydrolase n=1 Tax=Paenibacillus protaetiae TaxID=2509456 RepID=A0A4P6EZL1_9BACL|nr:HAD family hydrolase [Paenibacillus protaetiae]QAY67259.1 HAD family hydrolase [Paenibacillus protaetiae]
MLLKGKQAVFFDVDDTLYDHLAPFRTAVEQAAGADGMFPYEEAYHRLRYYSDTLSAELGGTEAMEAAGRLEWMRSERFRRTLGEFGMELSEQEAAAVQAAYIGCQYRFDMFPGARELIGRLKEAGHVVGLITNGAGAHQQKKIDSMQLEELIPAELQFITGVVGWDKPDRRIFDHVCGLTGVAPEDSCYIGDSWRNDVIGALGAGWTAIWLNHRHQQPETAHKPHHIASSYEELSRLLLG